jgi:hypothetical protein
VWLGALFSWLFFTGQNQNPWFYYAMPSWGPIAYNTALGLPMNAKIKILNSIILAVLAKEGPKKTMGLFLIC